MAITNINTLLTITVVGSIDIKPGNSPALYYMPSIKFKSFSQQINSIMVSSLFSKSEFNKTNENSSSVYRSVPILFKLYSSEVTSTLFSATTDNSDFNKLPESTMVSIVDSPIQFKSLLDTNKILNTTTVDATNGMSNRTSIVTKNIIAQYWG